MVLQLLPQLQVDLGHGTRTGRAAAQRLHLTATARRRGRRRIRVIAIPRRHRTRRTGLHGDVHALRVVRRGGRTASGPGRSLVEHWRTGR